MLKSVWLSRVAEKPRNRRACAKEKQRHLRAAVFRFAIF
jgi:hypothetical protein